MASLYRKPIVVRDPRTGKKTKSSSKKWWGRFRDVDGSEKRVPLATDKHAARAMLDELVKKVERRVAGLTDPFEENRQRPLSQHVDDFVAYLKNKGSTKDYVNSTEQRIKAIVKDCKFVRMDQISASRVQAFLSDLRSKGRSVGSSNHYLRAMKMFTRWLVKDRRSSDDRLTHLSKMNVDAHRCRVRRPLSMDEFGKLLKAAQDGPAIQHVSGSDRVILYILAAYTGYRRNEIGSITMQSFDFESVPPTLTVDAGHSKHRRQDVLPLRGDFAEQIKAWIKSKKSPRSDRPLFDIAGKHTAEMIRKDLKRAGVPYVDVRGHYADFHSLRKTFITNLSRAGVSPKTAQLLARHSDINLTMNTYTMLGVCDQASAVESLPAIPGVSATDGANALADRPKVAQCDTAA
jgi:integrase/recombinase XerD